MAPLVQPINGVLNAPAWRYTETLIVVYLSH